MWLVIPSRYFEVLPVISRHFEELLGSFRYFEVSLDTSRYFKVLLNTLSWHNMFVWVLEVLLGILRIFEVPWSTLGHFWVLLGTLRYSKYFEILLCTPGYFWYFYRIASTDLCELVLIWHSANWSPQVVAVASILLCLIFLSILIDFSGLISFSMREWLTILWPHWSSLAAFG